LPSPESQQYLAKLREGEPFGTHGFDFDGLRFGMALRRKPDDPAVLCQKADADGVRGEWVLAPGADAGVRLLYLHGGGFVSGSGACYLPLAAHISAAAGCVVFLPDYRLAPEHPYPAGLEDCVRAHEWLRANGPDGPSPARVTFIAGDSAGGGLTLSTLLALRDRDLTLPAGGIPLSPFADLTLSGDSIRSQAGLDPIMHPSCLPRFVELYLAGAPADDPLASPLFADLAGLPPLLIQVGEHEIIRDDSVRVAGRAKAAGVDVTLEIWEGLFHVFQSHEPLLPEAREAVAHIGEFVRRRA